jgi:nicotinamidase-related amidase
MLIDREKSCLVVIDVQACFLDKLPADERAPLVARIAWLVRVARVLDVPVIAMAEDIARQGPLVREVASALPDDAVVFDKMVFGLAGQPDILAAVEKTGRRDVILTGLETDTCVAQSALGLAGPGYRVVVVEDAVGSPAPGHAHGIDRMARAGVIVTTVKGLYYEWVRDVATDDRVKAAVSDTPRPPGLVL